MVTKKLKKGKGEQAGPGSAVYSVERVLPAQWSPLFVFDANSLEAFGEASDQVHVHCYS